MNKFNFLLLDIPTSPQRYFSDYVGIIVLIAVIILIAIYVFSFIKNRMEKHND
ncbi:MAG: hypothetical protein IPK18_09415 [Sphingobacteriales bacterium]|nr:MAG: hypothetical protein IPK18_09415 [Sphingobacteriales bacterium]